MGFDGSWGGRPKCLENARVKPIFEAWLAPFADLGATTLSGAGLRVLEVRAPRSGEGVAE